MDAADAPQQSESGTVQPESPSGSVSFGRLVAGMGGRFLASNPLYFASAGFLLYGVNRLSVNPALAGAESSQLKFNFCALLLYELLVVATAAVLARRRIWYDAMLLAVLENLFVLVPFSLVTRAALVDHSGAWMMCACAAAFGAAKLWALRHYFRELHVPGRWVVLGILAIALNLVIAMAFRSMDYTRHESWPWLQVGWLIGLPVLLSFINLLPLNKPRIPGLVCGWFPHTMALLWVVVTACHLAGAGYIHSFEWRWSLSAPTLWILAWTLRRYERVLAGTRFAAVRKAIPYLPLAAVLLAGGSEGLFAVLCGLNAAIFCWLWLKQKRADAALNQFAVAFIMALAGTPTSWVRLVMPEFTRGAWVFCCVAAGVALLAFRSKDPRIGIPCGIGAAVATGLVAPPTSATWHLAGQLGLVYMLLHSMRWPDESQPGTRPARTILAILWVSHAFLISFGNDAATRWVATPFAILILASWLVVTLLRRFRAAAILPASAVAVLLSTPVGYAAKAMRDVPSGFLSILIGFLLFACGTIAALIRDRWRKPQAERSS